MKMRTLARTLEHLLVIGLCGGLCYAGACYVAHKLGNSFNPSAALIANAGSAR
jgi:hypothetical protein